jgi:hypothetical protein
MPRVAGLLWWSDHSGCRVNRLLTAKDPQVLRLSENRTHVAWASKRTAASLI